MTPAQPKRSTAKVKTPDDLVLARVVFADSAGDPDLHPLFLDAGSWSTLDNPDDEAAALARARGNILAGSQQSIRVGGASGRNFVTGRRTLTVPDGDRISLASYFNAFPASYWRRWTRVDSVLLRVRTSGTGQLVVYRSNARAVTQVVTTIDLSGTADNRVEIPLNNFLDGGWLWFDLIAEGSDLDLVEADWAAAADVGAVGTATVAITTLNKTEYCLEVIRALSDESLVGLLDSITVIDQGSQPLRAADGFEAVEALAGGRLNVIEQANLGGAGGFARGMLETLRAEASDHVILLDDDVVVEPESVARAITFASLCVKPTIVGGHMFDMYDRTKLHAFAESINPATFFWGPISPTRHDLAASNLRQTPWMHQRMDAGYTGWWMCLIPVAVVKEIGLPIPVFIKWDDAEYGVRAREHGFPVVSVPGVGIWHVSWVDKDDSRDWQAFYHARNRLVAALLHSDRAHGGLVVRSNLAQDLRYLLTMDYYVVQLRLDAYRSVLAGPAALHKELPTRLGRIRSTAAKHPEAQPVTDFADIPNFAPRAVPGERLFGVDTGPRGVGMIRWIARQVASHSRGSAADPAKPSAHLAFADARWWVVPDFDSVLISNADGSSASPHARDPRKFRSMLAQSIKLNLRYRRAWAELAEQYRAALPEITSPDAWASTFGLDRRPADRPE